MFVILCKICYTILVVNNASGGNAMVKEFFGVQIDTSNMTTEELLETQRKITKLLADVKLQLRLRKMAGRKHSSENH